MKKNAFTLMEFIVALGVVGVIAVVAGTTMSNISPDRYKAKFMNAYTTISQANQDLLSDPAFYINRPHTSNANGLIYNVKDKEQGCTGLACTDAPTDSDLIATYTLHPNSTWFKGKNKYPSLLAYKLSNTTNGKGRVALQGYLKDDQAINLNNGVRISVESIENEWKTDSSNGNTKTCTYKLYIEIRNPKHPNSYCEFGHSNDYECTQHNAFNKFEFEVNNDGKLIPVDKLSQAYLETPTQMNNRSADYTRARCLLHPDNSNCAQLNN